MNEIDPDRVDLNLLLVFQALMRDRSVTRAAAQLGRGQPAISHALGRLRRLFDDPLFLRAGRNIEPTARALDIAQRIEPALAALADAMHAVRPFDPLTAEPVFRIGLTDDLQIVLLARLMQRLRAGIPNSRLVVLGSDYHRAFRLLDSGEAATVLGHVEALPAQAMVRNLRPVRYRVLRDRATGPILDLDDYCARPHILVSSAGDMTGIIDEALVRLDRTRNVITTIPLFGALPTVIRGSEAIATVPAHLAAALSDAGLANDALPIDSPGYELRIAWRGAVDRDPAEQMFRSLLMEAVRDGLHDAVPPLSNA